MDDITKQNIKNYIQQYKNIYPKESISQRLIQSGITQNEIDSIYNEIDSQVSNQPTQSPPYQKKDLSNVTEYREKNNSSYAIYGLIILVLISIGTFAFFMLTNYNTEENSNQEELINQQQALKQEILTPVCNTDNDCNDNLFSTSDHCFSEKNACVNIPIMICIDNDNYCPQLCTKVEDSDCDNEYYNYKDSYFAFQSNYYDNWNISKDLTEQEFYFEHNHNYILISFTDYDSLENEEEMIDRMIEYYSSLVDNFTYTEKGYNSDNKPPYAYLKYNLELNSSSYIVENRIFFYNDEILFIHQTLHNFTDEKLINQIEDMKNSFKFYNATNDTSLKDKYKQLDKPFLWKIEHENYTHSHIFGTIHLTKSALFK
jgi:hypothetical protein